MERVAVALSRRERLIAVSFANGLDAERISVSLGLSIQTIDAYMIQVRRAYSKANRNADTAPELRACLVQDKMFTDDGLPEQHATDEAQPENDAPAPSGISYRVIFEGQIDSQPLEHTRLVSVWVKNGAFPSSLVDPLDYKGEPVQGTWLFNEALETHHVAFYLRAR